ncbi:hypothetical protein R3P38DRAFT_2779684 [Favolaschia claudopus]|uniref:Alpha-type protein kinase domain-containing protein n=1 Tax=Favolaschia claudopus TaxID=2862362 RepID=A0AAW0BEE1_9AGAR
MHPNEHIPSLTSPAESSPTLHSNPIDPPPITHCMQCGRSEYLSDEKRCEGKGQDVCNWDRRAMGALLSTSATLIRHRFSQVPIEVQIRWATKASLEIAKKDNTAAHLECTGPSCHGSNAQGQPRRANKECARLYCATCCRAAGGCSKHSSRVEESGVTSMPAPPSSTDGSDSSGDSRRYARALSEDYSRGWLGARLEGLQESRSRAEVEDDLAKNVVQVLVWFKGAPQPPKSFTTKGEDGKLVVSNIPALSAVVQDGFICVLLPSSPPSWTIYDSRLPITISPGFPILLKALDVEICFNLDVEAPRIIGSTPLAAPYLNLNAALVASVPVASAAATPSIPSPALPVAPAAASDNNARNTALVNSYASVDARLDQFPHRFASDMVPKMEALLSSRSETLSVEAAYGLTFDKIPYVMKTVYKHINIYNLAKKFGILDEVAVFGRSPNGTWAKVVRRVDELRKGPAPAILNLTQGSLTVGDMNAAFNPSESGPQNTVFVDESTRSESVSALISYYQSNNDGILVDFRPPALDASQPVTILEECAWWGRFVPASRSTRRAGDCCERMYDDDARVVWLEGARASELNRLCDEFRKRAEDMNVQLPDFEVAAICLITDTESEKLSLAQPWRHGTRVDMINFDATRIWFAQALTALSHYTYEASNFNSVYVDFEGFFISTGYRIFDSRTHVKDIKSNLCGSDFLGSMGASAVEGFHMNHKCNDYCVALKLVLNKSKLNNKSLNDANERL